MDCKITQMWWYKDALFSIFRMYGILYFSLRNLHIYLCH
jgi:hypothetical protein